MFCSQKEIRKQCKQRTRICTSLVSDSQWEATHFLLNTWIYWLNVINILWSEHAKRVNGVSLLKVFESRLSDSQRIWRAFLFWFRLVISPTEAPGKPEMLQCASKDKLLAPPWVSELNGITGKTCDSCESSPGKVKMVPRWFSRSWEAHLESWAAGQGDSLGRLPGHLPLLFLRMSPFSPTPRVLHHSLSCPSSLGLP